MPKPSHRDSIISAGLQTMFRKGYVGASVRDVVTAAGVPQGSFTNHFSSKEAFAGEVLAAYFEHVRSLVRQAFEDASLTPGRRLVRYLDLITERLDEDGYVRGCLIGDLSIEAPGHSEALRQQLLAIYDEWRGLFAAGIRDAQRSGELASVRDSFMTYRTAGDQPDAPNALFLHGNPTSSYIWRNIIPTVGTRARCIAPDLIGFGQSGQPDIDYRFTQIAEYLDAFIDSLGVTSAYLVAQDWGTAFALHLAARRPELVRGLAFMEFIRPMPTWQDFHQSEQARRRSKRCARPVSASG